MIIESYNLTDKLYYIGYIFADKDCNYETGIVASNSINVGCFIRKTKNGFEELDENSTSNDVYGFVPEQERSCKYKNRKIIKKGNIVAIARLTNYFLSSPYVCSYDTEYPSTIKVIIRTNNPEKYLNGSVVLSTKDETDEFKTVTIPGRLRVFNNV